MRLSTSLNAALAALLLFFTATIPAQETIVPYAEWKERLRADLEQRFQDAELGGSARLGVFVANADTGQILLERDADRPFVPASVLKVATAAAALEYLGPDKRFFTFLETDGRINRGTLEGSLRLMGGGDPALGPRFQVDKADTAAVFREFAKDMKRLGINRVRGDVFGDDTLFSADRFAPGWPRRESAEWYAAQVSALCFNDNCVDVVIKAARREGQKAKVTIRPETEFLFFVNNIVTTGDRTREEWVRFQRSDSGEEMVGRGILHPSAERTEYAAISTPDRFAATVLKEALAKEGIRVEGQALSFRTLHQDDWPTTGTTTLSSTVSAPLSTLLPEVLAVSQNLYAEVLLRHVAIAAGKEPSFAGGASAVLEYMSRLGTPMSGLVVMDGSGLSRGNRLSPQAVGQVLLSARNGAHFRTFLSSLAVPGERGSMRNRFTEAERRELRGRLNAKTGYLTGAIGLAGYLKSSVDDTRYVFVIFLNDYAAPREDAQRFVEEVTILLAQSPALP